MILRKINIELKKILLEKNLTQRELAGLTGIPEQLISMISRGLYIPNPTQIEKISRILDVTPGRIFK